MRQLSLQTSTLPFTVGEWNRTKQFQNKASEVMKNEPDSIVEAALRFLEDLTVHLSSEGACAKKEDAPILAKHTAQDLDINEDAVMLMMGITRGELRRYELGGELSHITQKNILRVLLLPSTLILFSNLSSQVLTVRTANKSGKRVYDMVLDARTIPSSSKMSFSDMMDYIS